MILDAISIQVGQEWLGEGEAINPGLEMYSEFRHLAMDQLSNSDLLISYSLLLVMIG